MPGGRRQPRGRAKRPSRSERHQRARAAGVNAAVARAEGKIEITLPVRRVQPESVVAHLGPTNSGKTYHALEVLKERGRGVYAGPLRMLALEAHRRLSAELGEDAVGLVTGEERINESAPIICCTVEMAPSSGEVLVLDEVQWADDPERGSAWTRLLLAGDYRHILVLGALDAEPLVLNAFPEAEVKVFERILPLEFVGERALRGLTPGTVVVAFSRKAVLALAGEINRLHPDRVSVLYGAMPLSSRREEIDRFLSGRSDVTVATDVLGHGVNLPCETLLFAETTKFDGESRRDLLPWELAQIAGRAGRFGLVERGHVGVLTGIPWASADPEIVEEALQPHVVLPSGHLGYRIVDEARIRPRLADLGVDDPRRLDAALAAWHRVATRAWAHEGWLAVESLSPIRGRLAAIQRRLDDRNRRLSIEDTWKLINAPVDEDNAELLSTLALALAVLVEALFLALWLRVDAQPTSGEANWLIAILALAMGIQTAAVFSLGVRAVFTTAATATLAALMGDLSQWPESAADRRRLASVLVGLFAGAVAGGLLMTHAPSWAPASPLVLTGAVVAIAARRFTAMPSPVAHSAGGDALHERMSHS